MADLIINYKGQTVLELSESGTKTLKTAGKYCEDDITVGYVKPAGGGATEPYIEETYDIDGNLIAVVMHGHKNVRSSAFQGCKSLTSITIPNSVTNIGNYAFDGCTSLSSITIPNGVTSIGEYAFKGCSFVNVTIPNSVTSMGSYAFKGCTSLTRVMI